MRRSAGVRGQVNAVGKPLCASWTTRLSPVIPAKAGIQ